MSIRITDKDAALWATVRAQTFRLDAERTITLAHAMAHSPRLAAARVRYAVALEFCAEIMDECAKDLSP